jgi:hypothetical protein
MTASRISVAILACGFLVGACGDNWMRGDDIAGADGSIVGAPDGAPILPDATPPSPDAEPDIDLPGLVCSLDDVLPVIECVVENCLDSFADGSALTCVAFSCGLLLLGLPPECSQCILTALSNPEEALDACFLGLDDLGGFPIPPAP